jgi:Raf kinase inhibitor-like YbhB/YbcL family protein
MLILLPALWLIAILTVSCGAEEQPPLEGEMTLAITSPAFLEGDKIPDKHTCQGQDVSPPLAWSEPPEGTRSFTLIMDDLDAPGGVFIHWVIFNIPSDSRGLPEAVPTQEQLPSGALQGENNFGRIGYGGPCPPSGNAHQYKFTLYALEEPLSLKAGTSKKQVLEAMQGHILAQGELMGIYQR